MPQSTDTVINRPSEGLYNPLAEPPRLHPEGVHLLPDEQAWLQRDG